MAKPATTPENDTPTAPADVPVTDIPVMGWAEPGDHRELPEEAMRFLTEIIGEATPHQPVEPESIDVGETHLSAEVVAALAAIVGRDHVVTDAPTRALHAGGKSYADLLRRRAGDARGAPGAIVFPAGHDEVMALLRLCSDRGIAVVPFGGGTSVVGGLEPLSGGNDGVVSIDLRRMDALVAVDEESMLVTLEPGLRGPQVEAQLGEHGLTLGHFPQSFQHATVGGWVATRSAGQASTGYGRIDERVVGLRVATPAGEIRLGGHPASAAGPDLVQLFVGSEGTLGVVTEVTLRAYPSPKASQYEGWVFKTFEDGLAAFRELAQRGLAPDVSRLSDVDESRATIIMSGTDRRAKQALDTYLRFRRIGPTPCMTIVGWEGTQAGVSARREAAAEALQRHGAVRVGRRLGDAWERNRYHGPMLRDTLLDEGILCETLETATTWSSLEQLYAAVRTALVDSLTEQGTPPYLMCHVSHLYATGASLYFTVMARQVAADPAANIEQWFRAKAAASEAILAAGGTITHHHAIGTDHMPYLPAEIGDLGIEVLRAVKASVDPAGILNPGKLIPASDG